MIPFFKNSAYLCACILSFGMADGVVVNLTNETFGSGSIAPNVLIPTSGPSFRGGFINGALFRDPSVTGSSGSGVFRDLFRLTPPNTQGSVTESGYNRVAMDSVIPGGFDPIIKVSDLVTDASGGSYIFVIDINESNNPQRYLSLDDFKVWVGGTSDIDPSMTNSLEALQAELGINNEPVYEMNPEGSRENVLLMDATLSSGSGSGDVFIFVPKSYFGVSPNQDAYVYIYAAMGEYTDEPGFGAGATHEQVSLPGKTYTGVQSGVPVPEPNAALLLLVSVGGLMAYRRR